MIQGLESETVVLEHQTLRDTIVDQCHSLVKLKRGIVEARHRRPDGFNFRGTPRREGTNNVRA